MTSDPPHSRFGYVVERITVLTALPLTTLLPHCYPSLASPLLPSQYHLRHVHNTKAQRIHKSTELLVPITSSVLNITGFRKAASRPRSMRFI